jgi:hypothetical protein
MAHHLDPFHFLWHGLSSFAPRESNAGDLSEPKGMFVRHTQQKQPRTDNLSWLDLAHDAFGSVLKSCEPQSRKPHDFKDRDAIVSIMHDESQTSIQKHAYLIKLDEFIVKQASIFDKKRFDLLGARNNLAYHLHARGVTDVQYLFFTDLTNTRSHKGTFLGSYKGHGFKNIAIDPNKTPTQQLSEIYQHAQKHGILSPTFSTEGGTFTQGSRLRSSSSLGGMSTIRETQEASRWGPPSNRGP